MFLSEVKDVAQLMQRVGALLGVAPLNATLAEGLCQLARQDPLPPERAEIIGRLGPALRPFAPHEWQPGGGAGDGRSQLLERRATLTVADAETPYDPGVVPL